MSGASGSIDGARLESMRSERTLDVVCVGSALVDHLVFCDFDILAALGLTAGTMTLVDGATTARLRELTGGGEIVSGGAEANTAAGVASFGGRSAFVGAVGTDPLGAGYAADLEAIGVRVVLEHVAPERAEGASTGSSMVIVTPDKERTMLTSLGVAPRLDHRVLDEALFAETKVLYFSAYSLDFSGADALVATIGEMAKQQATTVAFSLADPFAVERHHRAIVDLLDIVDVMFANEHEASALTGASSVHEAIDALRGHDQISVVTRGAKGATIATPETIVEIAAAPVASVVDLTGAGDLFAAGVLFGMTTGLSLEGSARLGALAAAEVISHSGARPETPLASLLDS